VLWASWHLPVKFNLALSYGAGGFLGLYGVLTVKFVLLSLIMAYFVNRAGGSISLAIAMHGISNQTVGIGAAITSEALGSQLLFETVLVVPIAVVAATIVWRTRGRLGLPPELAPPRPRPPVGYRVQDVGRR
jgi:hypothetical protein